MAEKKEKRTLYGYEDYEVFDMSTYNIVINNETRGQSGSNNYYRLCIEPHLLKNYKSEFDVNALEVMEHPKLLDNARKIYIHPSSTISRDMVRRKFATSINAVGADAIVIPKPNKEALSVHTEAIFVNDSAMKVYMFRFDVLENRYYYHDVWEAKRMKTFYNEVKGLPPGIRFSEIAQISSVIDYTDEDKPGMKDLADAELVSVGPVLYAMEKAKYIIDLITYVLPKDRIVYEDTLLKALGDESNEPTIDSLTSIYDMMKSTDPAIRELGMKTLATMDYIHYPVCVNAILDNTDWRRDTRFNSTAVKFMLASLNVNPRYYKYRRTKSKCPYSIAEKDWNLYQELIKHIDRTLDDEDTWLGYCIGLNFINRVDHYTGEVSPNFQHE